MISGLHALAWILLLAASINASSDSQWHGGHWLGPLAPDSWLSGSRSRATLANIAKMRDDDGAVSAQSPDPRRGTTDCGAAHSSGRCVTKWPLGVPPHAAHYNEPSVMAALFSSVTNI